MLEHFPLHPDRMLRREITGVYRPSVRAMPRRSSFGRRKALALMASDHVCEHRAFALHRRGGKVHDDDEGDDRDENEEGAGVERW
jgi:hypothetical protein